MARRQQSKQARTFEAVAGLAAPIAFLWFFPPGFRAGIQILLSIVVVLALIALAIWLLVKSLEREQPSTTFRTFTYNPSPSGKRFHNQPKVFVEELKVPPPVPKLNISEKLRRIDWFQFEKLIELIYQHRGFKVRRLGGANPDGGVDLIAESSTEKFAIQCKHWRKWKVSIKDIREFLGALTDSKIQKGVFITLAGYSGEARQLANKHQIKIVNEADLVEMLETSDLVYSKEISKLFSDERKYCPKCEAEMVLKSNRKTGDKFWGCSTFPRCWFKFKCAA